MAEISFTYLNGPDIAALEMGAGARHRPAPALRLNLTPVGNVLVSNVWRRMRKTDPKCPLSRGKPDVLEGGQFHPRIAITGSFPSGAGRALVADHVTGKTMTVAVQFGYKHHELENGPGYSEERNGHKFSPVFKESYGLHHISFSVSDLVRSATFYDALLGPLGYRRVCEDSDFVGYGVEDNKDKFAIKARIQDVASPSAGFHLAFAA
jgi:hypothetical protein